MSDPRPAATSGSLWTDREDGIAVEEIAQAIVHDGLSKNKACRAASVVLGRGFEAVKFRAKNALAERLAVAITALRAQASSASSVSAEAAVAVPAPAVVQELVPVSADAPVSAAVAAAEIAQPVEKTKLPPLDLARGATQRAMWAELNALGYAGGWSAGLDLDILKGLARGEKIGAIAVDMGFDSAAVQARFVLLRDAMLAATCADRVTIDGQRALLEALQARDAWFRGLATA